MLVAVGRRAFRARGVCRVTTCGNKLFVFSYARAWAAMDPCFFARGAHIMVDTGGSQLTGDTYSSNEIYQTLQNLGLNLEVPHIVGGLLLLYINIRSTSLGDHFGYMF